MVPYSQILASNALIPQNNTHITTSNPLIAIFAPGTSGIAQHTLTALVSTKLPMKIYLIGRPSSSSTAHTFIQSLTALNPHARIIWTEGNISLLSETRRICNTILTSESHIDILFLSGGYAPFGPRDETPEGHETTQTLAVYSRLLFTLLLLPLLHAAPAGRVISVLGGGMERDAIDIDDLDLRKPGAFGVVSANAHYVGINTMVMERLGRMWPGVTFLHSCPGWVDTGNVKRGRVAGSVTDWLLWMVLEPMIWLFSKSGEECGQRYLFQCMSALYGGRGVEWRGAGGGGVNTLGQRGNGLFLVCGSCECVRNERVVGVLREKSQQRIWDHTMEVLKEYL